MHHRERDVEQAHPHRHCHRRFDRETQHKRDAIQILHIGPEAGEFERSRDSRHGHALFCAGFEF
jgi:hypothetical protein